MNFPILSENQSKIHIKQKEKEILAMYNVKERSFIKDPNDFKLKLYQICCDLSIRWRNSQVATVRLGSPKLERY